VFISTLNSVSEEGFLSGPEFCDSVGASRGSLQERAGSRHASQLSSARGNDGLSGDTALLEKIQNKVQTSRGKAATCQKAAAVPQVSAKGAGKKATVRSADQEATHPMTTRRAGRAGNLRDGGGSRATVTSDHSSTSGHSAGT
jgi:hypothetical protein